MIKNDRQYRITKVRAQSFGTALQTLVSQTESSNDLAIRDLQTAALRSQYDELTADIAEYEALKSGAALSFEASSLVDLPLLLVKVRIARGLTQRQLAERLNVKEQQVQRWEALNFQGASLVTLTSVASALGVVLTQELIAPQPDLTAEKFLAFLRRSGVSTELVLDRILPPRIASVFRDGSAAIDDIVAAASALARVFQTRAADLLTISGSVQLPEIASVRFKLPAKANRRAVDAYTVFAHYLGAVLVDTVQAAEPKTLPVDPHVLFEKLTSPQKPLTFSGVLQELWGYGILVIPLREAGGFHGAVWKLKGHFVIVLKQTTDLESRWLYDLLHETGHIAKGHVTDDTSVLELTEISPNGENVEEDEANEWAEDVILGCKSEEIEEYSTKACHGQLQKLKAILPSVAEKFNVNLGSLANHMAHRLAQQGENWWGAANSLQQTSVPPFASARETLLKHADLRRLGEFDRELVQRSLTEG